MPVSKSSITVTPFASFYMAKSPDGPRYYPSTPDQRVKARAVSDTDPALVQGFAVYDATRTVEYAIAIYPTKEAAEAHAPSEAPERPDAIIGGDAAGKYKATDDTPSPSGKKLNRSRGLGLIKPREGK
jgi:hypothetical protein